MHGIIIMVIKMTFDQDLLSRIVLMVMVPFVFVILVMPYVKKLANKIGAVDIPRSRHIHNKTTPKLGGLAIFLGFLLFSLFSLFFLFTVVTLY